METATKKIPSGYKTSPLGPIPEDWEVMRLECAFHLQGGFAFKSEEYKDSGIPIVRISNLPQNGKYVDINDCVYSDRNDISKQFHIRRDDLLIAMSGATTGKVAVYKDKNCAYLNQRVGLFKQTSSDIIYQYLTFLVTSDMYSNQLKPLLIAGAQPNIAPADIENLRFPIPPISEQERICNVLSLWDTAIAKQTALIEKLALRKRGLMQQLLTGKKRLKGFEGEWSYHAIQDHFSEIRDKNDGKGHIPMTISAKLGLVSQTHKFDRVVAGNSLDNYTLLRKGDFAYNKGNSNLYETGCIYRLKEDSAIVPFVYICFRAIDNTCCEFYQQFFINHGLDKQLKQIITSGARGDGLLNVNSDDFMALKIPYPKVDEQIAIASILTDADKELEIQKQKLAAMQAQKKGLMQVLLTGKKRIKLK